MIGASTKPIYTSYFTVEHIKTLILDVSPADVVGLLNSHPNKDLALSLTCPPSPHTPLCDILEVVPSSLMIMYINMQPLTYRAHHRNLQPKSTLNLSSVCLSVLGDVYSN